MSSIGAALTKVFQTAHVLPLDESSKYIIFSDCHRGDGGWADDFADNQNLLFHALRYYYQNEFTYIELGDGDELWENASFEDIRRAYSHIYWLMGEFYKQKRLYIVWGNHNFEWSDPAYVEKHFYTYVDERTEETMPLFPGIMAHEGLILQTINPEQRLFLVHGHQGDAINDRYAKIGRFLVRYLWRNLQLLGVHDPTSPAQNFNKRNQVEGEIMRWARSNKQILIGGHTHQPAFPRPTDPPYFNTGSCVHPRCITGIEIQNQTIALIKWSVQPDEQGALHILREHLEPAEHLDAYFEALT